MILGFPVGFGVRLSPPLQAAGGRHAEVQPMYMVGGGTLHIIMMEMGGPSVQHWHVLD